MSPTVFLENAMSRKLNIAIPAALLLSALALSAFATKPVPVAAPAPVVVAAEQPPAPEVAVEPAPLIVAEHARSRRKTGAQTGSPEGQETCGQTHSAQGRTTRTRHSTGSDCCARSSGCNAT